MDDEDEFYTVPLTGQRAFGAGLKRKRIQFVPASNATNDSPNTSARTGANVEAEYLAVVLSGSRENATKARGTAGLEIAGPPQGSVEKCKPEDSDIVSTVCEVCKQEIPTHMSRHNHDVTLAHQVSEKHSSGPSAVDRRRKGLAVLQAYGWDPDLRIGLGATGDGILHPIRAKPKYNTKGIGADAEPEKPATVTSGQTKRKLNAKQLQRQARKGKNQRAQLHEQFYGGVDVEKYLGTE